VYGTADGRWLTVAAIEPRFWANLCAAVGLERWATHQTDDAVQDEIRRDLSAVLCTRTRDEWVDLLAPGDTCVAPVLEVSEVAADAQYVARGDFAVAKHAEHGSFRQVGATLAGMVEVADDVEVRDAAITDTDEVLAWAGLSAEEISALRDSGAAA
jgi:crotonobetainyl-CoA:carnitine CoA-transferase CaiB-like acyl-CoA transferase